MIYATGPISEVESLHNCWVALLEASLVHWIENLDISFAVRIRSELDKLGLIEVKDARSCHCEIGFNLEIVLISLDTVELLQVIPARNTAEFVVWHAFEAIVRWRVEDIDWAILPCVIFTELLSLRQHYLFYPHLIFSHLLGPIVHRHSVVVILGLVLLLLRSTCLFLTFFLHFSQATFSKLIHLL